MKNLFKIFWLWILGIIKTLNVKTTLTEVKNTIYVWKNFRSGKNITRCKLIEYVN